MELQKTLSWFDHPQVYAEWTGIPLATIKAHIPKEQA